MLFVVFRPSLLIYGVLHRGGRQEGPLNVSPSCLLPVVLRLSLVALDIWGPSLKLGPLARNFLAAHETLRIWGSLVCRIKTQHQSCHIHPPRSPQLAAFRNAAFFTSACSQKSGWFPDLADHMAAKNPLLLSSPRTFRVYSWSRPPLTSADSVGFSCLRVEWSSTPTSQNQRKNSRDLFIS